MEDDEALRTAERIQLKAELDNRWINNIIIKYNPPEKKLEDIEKSLDKAKEFISNALKAQTEDASKRW